MTTRVLLLLALASAGCPKGPSGGDHKTAIEPTASRDAKPSRLLPDDDDGGTAAIVLPPAPPLPAVPSGLPPLAPQTRPIDVVTPDAVALGELLFFEPRLARDGKTTCATCHDPAHGYSGGLDKTATGTTNSRRTPALVNLAWVRELGWDGRAPSLDALLPAHLQDELGLDLSRGVPVGDNATYRAYFNRVPGTPQEALVHALEAYVLTRYEGGAPWDQLEATARRPRPGAAVDPIVAGYLVFAGRGQCAICHTPPLYTDGAYHAVVTRIPLDPGRQHGAFRTPSLRGAAARTSLLHDGSAHTLEQALDAHLYAIGGATGADGIYDQHVADPTLRKIQITAADRANLLAFVRALTAATPPPMKPVLP